MEFEIKEIKKEAIDDFLAFAKGFIFDQFVDYPPKVRKVHWKNEFDRDKLIEEIKKDKIIILTAVLEGKIIGFTMLHFSIGGGVHIEWLGTDKYFRSKGVGTLLLKKVEEVTMKHYCHFIYIWAETKKNIEFYKKRGYYLVGLQKESWFGINEYLMQKNLRKPFEEIFK